MSEWAKKPRCWLHKDRSRGLHADTPELVSRHDSKKRADDNLSAWFAVWNKNTSGSENCQEQPYQVLLTKH